jgi:Holliday junction resolvasome RuvABC endonuclease subunit
MAIIGIDYSMSCPAIAIHVGEDWSFSNCTFHFLTAVKKHVIDTNNIKSTLYQKKWLSNEERFDYISSWAINIIQSVDSPKLYVEDYAYSAKGVVFHIGECMGILKHKVWTNYPHNLLNPIAPSTIKKFATGKGNANKLAMYESFVQETQFDISATLDCSEGESPMSDVIDAYYIAKYGFFLDK